MEPISLGPPREERADAARNRAHLLQVARAMVDELGVDKVTMDGLAARAGLGKGTVFRRFGTRAGIFYGLLDEEETQFQQRLLTGPPPLGPGAPPARRLVAFGRARLEFLVANSALCRAAIDPGQPIPMGQSPSRLHVHTMLREACPDIADHRTLTLQLLAALEGPILLYVHAPDKIDPGPLVDSLATGWQILIERVCGCPSGH
ncbi:TetR/AcrR family transcriptional regulator [Kutzneria sp. NPDC052558]|uniref:TetR/AcrR family transcriptional regulator n=1 Tax=Kutzneria sp. NPDC052558 TaxID=3364121 RepID=UPI0037C9A9D3